MIKTTLRPYFDRFRERFLLGVVREEQLDQLYDRLYDQIAGMMQIQSAIVGGAVMKPMRQWALSPDAMALILADLQERSLPRVVEFGCGQSTVIFASWMRHHGGTLRSFEHDPAHADTISQQLKACGLLSYVELEVVPLVEQPAVGSMGAAKSYALPAAADAFDVALIDGPPKWAGESTRYYPLAWAVERLNAGGAAYLDDSARPPEQRILQEMAARRPEFAAEELRAEKGLVRLRRKSPAS
jgi:predicted O-methyltransferase YrrM